MPSHSHQRKSRLTPKRSVSLLNLVLVTFFVILVSITLFYMFSYHFLAFRNANLILAASLVFIGLISLLLTVMKKAKKTTTVLLLVGIATSVGMLYFFKSLIDVSDKINKSASYSQVEMSVVVQKDSSISDIKQLSSVVAPTNNDGTNIADLLNKIQSDKGVSLSTEASDSYQKAYQTITEDTSKAMVLSSAYNDLLKQTDENYKDKVKTLYTYTLEKEIKTTSRKDANTDVFNLYVSGIDTYGPITSVSRSDVNIIMTVNRKTHKVLLTTTPRDAYVPIADGGNNQGDKLTHAGIYGINASIHTLENLYDTKIDYYARINFTSFITLVDLLGGIDVYNDQAFTAHTDKSYTFGVGNVHLDSKGALAFVRERYSLAGGDNDRGKNQEKVIAAIINKLSSVKAVSNYNQIVEGLGKSVQTNMPLDTIMSMANSQLETGSKYKVISQAVTGTGSTGELKSYAMPNASLYMLSLDDASLGTAKTAIKATLEGK